MSAQENGNRATEVREHLASEPTLLSWVRTGVGLISFGTVVERAGDGRARLPHARARHPPVLRSRRQCSSNQFVPTARTYLIVVTGSLPLGGMFVVYVLFAE